MPNLGMPEILLILVAALLLFGPKKLPDLGRSLGNGIREFRKGTAGLKEELEGSFKEEAVAAPPVPATQTILASTPAPVSLIPAQSAAPVNTQPVASQPVNLSKSTDAEPHQA
ncbi:twin-arginine translocase TatA/TatE family subunit [Deinococcus sp.]|uniref:twin-arginine translocase TatA/TatE family subunit n=1 Tax=Deinococcus sp. TaxID=47478 RepID=UPI0025D856B1|nr:twin-arginine translocase TatA/TatE family subunit [Deinococcus sp.]